MARCLPLRKLNANHYQNVQKSCSIIEGFVSAGRRPSRLRPPIAIPVQLKLLRGESVRLPFEAGKEPTNVQRGRTNS
jgi:hypothetical protein